MTEANIKETISSDFDLRFSESVYAVEATAFERSALAEQYKGRIDWVEDPNGLVQTVSIFADMPLTYQFWWVRLGGRLIVMYECAGELDAKGYIRELFRGLGMPQTKAINFMQVILTVTDGKGLAK